MRINKFIAQATGMSRRAADAALKEGRVLVNGQEPTPGQDVTDATMVTLDNRAITPDVNTVTIMLNKPVGYVVSRAGQGSKTIYDLLPAKFHQLKPVGRLDKDSSGLLLLTNDGQLAQELTHPSRQKSKVYEITLDKPLAPLHRQMISDHGVMLDDGPSKFIIETADKSAAQHEATAELQGEGQGDEFSSSPQRRDESLLITMHEGRNRQIRRTFAALGYAVIELHRTDFGNYRLDDLTTGEFQIV